MAFSFFKKSDKPSKGEAHGGPKYYDLTVKKVIDETRDAISVVFDAPPSGEIKYKSGQFLTIIVSVEGKEIRRAYSLCSSPFTDSDLAVTVKRVDGGLVSNWLTDNLKARTKFKVLQPMGQFNVAFAVRGMLKQLSHAILVALGRIHRTG